MTQMKVSSLNVDLIQDQASVGLFQQFTPVNGRVPHASVNVNVPLDTPGNEPESELRIKAIDQAKRALREAIRTLESYAA